LVLKIPYAAIIVAVASGILWIEHRHQIVTDAPTTAELDARAAAIACPDNENVPYGQNCIAFMQGDIVSDRIISAGSTQVTAPDGAAPACPPNNENKPYSASCIRFMSGWFWQPNAP
jgi:hypothetical protein